MSAGLPLLLGGLWGLALGLAFFLALRLTTRLYVAGGPLWQPLVLTLGRIIGAVGGFALLLPQGWLTVVAGLGGFTLARLLVRERAISLDRAAPLDRGV